MKAEAKIREVIHFVCSAEKPLRKCGLVCKGVAIVATNQKIFTRSAFEDFIQRPENADRMWELIDGEAIEKMPSNPYSSWIIQRILVYFMKYLEEHPVGYITGEAAGYYVGDEVLSPDGAFTTRELAEEGFQLFAPDLAIEVVSPSDKSREVRKKIKKYLKAEVIVWVVYPHEQLIDIWTPDRPSKSETKEMDDVLTLPDMLPGLSIPVRAVLEKRKST